MSQVEYIKKVVKNLGYELYVDSDERQDDYYPEVSMRIKKDGIKMNTSIVFSKYGNVRQYCSIYEVPATETKWTLASKVHDVFNMADLEHFLFGSISMEEATSNYDKEFAEIITEMKRLREIKHPLDEALKRFAEHGIKPVSTPILLSVPGWPVNVHLYPKDGMVNEHDIREILKKAQKNVETAH